jgi:hypothetical protein
VRANRTVAGTQKIGVELPADRDGPAGIGGLPSLAIRARERAVAQRG